VAAESGGNPLLAQELAQALGAGLEGVPRTLQALVRDRIERLPSLAAEILQTAAVLGPSFHIDCLERLLHLDEVVVVDALEVLERHALLRPGTAPASFDFRHELIHRAVYSGLSEPRRRLLHLKIAQLMRAQEPLDEAVALELAQHAALAGDDRLAAEACISAGHRCLRLLAGTEAEILARRSRRHAERLKEPDRTRFLIDSWRVLLAARPPASPEAIIQELEQLAERAVDFGLTEHARRSFRMLSLLRWERGHSSEAERDSLRGEILTRAGDDWQRILGLTEAARCLTLLERDPGQAEALVLEAQAMARGRKRSRTASPTRSACSGCSRARSTRPPDFRAARERSRRDGERSNEFMALEHLTKLEIRRGNCPGHERSRPSSRASPSGCGPAASCPSPDWSRRSAGWRRHRRGRPCGRRRARRSTRRPGRGRFQAPPRLRAQRGGLPRPRAGRRRGRPSGQPRRCGWQPSSSCRASRRSPMPASPDSPPQAAESGRRQPCDGPTSAPARQHLGPCARARRGGARRLAGGGAE
jgi:hypothetical protein